MSNDFDIRESHARKQIKRRYGIDLVDTIKNEFVRQIHSGKTHHYEVGPIRDFHVLSGPRNMKVLAVYDNLGNFFITFLPLRGRHPKKWSR